MGAEPDHGLPAITPWAFLELIPFVFVVQGDVVANLFAGGVPQETMFERGLQVGAEMGAGDGFAFSLRHVRETQAQIGQRDTAARLRKPPAERRQRAACRCDGARRDERENFAADKGGDASEGHGDASPGGVKPPGTL